VAVALFALLFGVIQGSEDGWDSAKVIGSFMLAAVFAVLFVLVERRSEAPLLRLDLFSNRIFVGSAVVTVIGMFAYLGTAYATSIRLSAIQGYSPLKTSIGFVCLNIMGVVLFPAGARMIERHNPGWTLVAGMAVIGIGDLWLSATPATNLSIAAVAVPLLIVGAGFKLAVTSITVVAVNSVPTDKAGMASGTTSMLRDFGLTRADRHRSDRPGPRGQRDVREGGCLTEAGRRARGVQPVTGQGPCCRASCARGSRARGRLRTPGGQLGARDYHPARRPDGAVQPAQDVAFPALSNAYSIGYLVCGVAALVAVLVLAGRSHAKQLDEQM
jgi:hypothetical protein